MATVHDTLRCTETQDQQSFIERRIAAGVNEESGFLGGPFELIMG